VAVKVGLYCSQSFSSNPLDFLIVEAATFQVMPRRFGFPKSVPPFFVRTIQIFYRAKSPLSFPLHINLSSEQRVPHLVNDTRTTELPSAGKQKYFVKKK
jgi:hypothetical protein